MIDILPKHYDTYDCYLNNIIRPISDYWNICYLPVFWGEFDFYCQNDHPHTFEDISVTVGSRDTRGMIWENYCGISIQNYRYNDFHKFKETIYGFINDEIPVGITMDSHHIPWNHYAQVRPHCILICGIDKESGALLCCDGIFHAGGMCKLDLNYLFNYYLDILSFNRVKVNKRDFKESLSYFIDVIKSSNSHKFEDLITFAHCIINCWEQESVEFLTTDISKSNFLLDLTAICNSRYNFMIGLQYFYQKFQTEQFFPIISDLEDLNNKWNAFKGLYIKATIIKENITIKKVSEILIEILRKEKALMRKLLYCESRIGLLL